MGRFVSRCVAAVVAAVSFLGVGSMAMAVDVIPAIGVTASEFVTELGTKLGAILVLVLGLALAVYIARTLLTWLFRAGKAR